MESRADRRRLELEKEAVALGLEDDDGAEGLEPRSCLRSRGLMRPVSTLATGGKALEAEVEVSAAETGGLVRGTEGALLMMDWGGEGWEEDLLSLD